MWPVVSDHVSVSTSLKGTNQHGYESDDKQLARALPVVQQLENPTRPLWSRLAPRFLGGGGAEKGNGCRPPFKKTLL